MLNEPRQGGVSFLKADVDLREPRTVFGNWIPTTDQHLVAV